MNTLTMNRQEILHELITFMGEKNMESAELCASRLYDVLPDKENMGNNGVLVAYGGGKDSSYMIAYVRLLHLILSKHYGSTFFLRVVTNRHAGMPSAVMENIDRVNRRLGIYEDPDVETLLIDGNSIRKFDKSLLLPIDVAENNLLKSRLENFTGLTLSKLRTLYNSTLLAPFPTIQTNWDTSPISVVLEGDPHKAMIETRQRSNGTVIQELLSGR